MTRPPTGIVLLNMGGPWELADVRPFLGRLFSDTEIIRLPAQRVLGPLIVRARLSRVRGLYAGIGGGSPLRQWTEKQAAAMIPELDELSPATAPHRAYLAFRYAESFAADALRQMKADGVRRAVAFSQYPQYSCTTSGSSFNDLRRAPLYDEFAWSLLDRWPAHPAYVEALAETVHEGLSGFPPERRARVPILFSAHSIPSRVVDRGDAYPQETGATVQAVMERLAVPNPYLLSFQSKVGPVSWQGPSTVSVTERLGASGVTALLVVGATFTSDHIETLSEIDVELRETAHRAGIADLRRAPALNDRPAFTRALARIAADHLAAGLACSAQYPLRCPGCDTPAVCRAVPRTTSAGARLGSR